MEGIHGNPAFSIDNVAKAVSDALERRALMEEEVKVELPELAGLYDAANKAGLTYKQAESMRAYLAECDIEGVVWHHPDGRMAKIKGKDFGLKRRAARL